jgi:hypothetical protein
LLIMSHKAAFLSWSNSTPQRFTHFLSTWGINLVTWIQPIFLPCFQVGAQGAAEQELKLLTMEISNLTIPTAVLYMINNIQLCACVFLRI